LQPWSIVTDLFVPGELIAFQQVDLLCQGQQLCQKIIRGRRFRGEGRPVAGYHGAPNCKVNWPVRSPAVKSQEAIYIASKANYEGR